MKMRRRRQPVALLLLVSILACEAASIEDVIRNKVRQEPGLVKDLSNAAVGSRAAPVGTDRAPVDGKDGMPHDGPWVQTDADRKKQKSNAADEEKVIVNTKTSSTSATDIPQTNNGVMDDRNRRKPQEGTRGTEGGVSEKSKDGSIVEKKPEQPKEAPPLPHSEKERMKIVAEDVESVVLGDRHKKPYAVCLPVLHLGPTHDLLGTDRFTRQIPRHCAPRKPILTKRQRNLALDSQNITNKSYRHYSRTSRYLSHSLPLPLLHHDHVLRDRRQNIPCGRPHGHAPRPHRRLHRRLLGLDHHDRP